MRSREPHSTTRQGSSSRCSLFSRTAVIENTIASSLKDKGKGQIPKDTQSLAQRPSGVVIEGPANLQGRRINLASMTYALMITPSAKWQAEFKQRGLGWVNLADSDSINNHNFRELPPERQPPPLLQRRVLRSLHIPVIGQLPKGFDVRRPLEKALLPTGVQKGQAVGEAANLALNLVASFLNSYLKARSDAAMAE